MIVQTYTGPKRTNDFWCGFPIGHKFKKDARSNGFSEYFECEKCGYRKVTQPRWSGVYQPVDWKWLRRGK